MWTGLRIEELCSLKVEQVKADHFVIEDAKPKAGWRGRAVESVESKRPPCGGPEVQQEQDRAVRASQERTGVM